MKKLYHFNAAGNVVLLLDAINSRQTAESLFEHVIVRNHSTLFKKFNPEIYAIVTETRTSLRADFWNPDASREKVCANALRCISYALCARGLHLRVPVFIETAHCRFRVCLYENNMAALEIPEQHIKITRITQEEWLIDPGTPHRVLFVDKGTQPNINELARIWSTGKNAVNGTFIQPGLRELKVRTFERGVGETGSCGTGALAAYLAWRQTIADKGKALPDDNLVRFESGNLFQINHRGGIITLKSHLNLKNILFAR